MRPAFVSYAGQDRQPARRVIDALKEVGVALLERPMSNAGQTLAGAIAGSLSTASAAVLMVSDAYLREHEVLEAVRLGVEQREPTFPVVPVILHRCDVEGTWLGTLAVANGNAAAAADLADREFVHFIERLAAFLSGAAEPRSRPGASGPSAPAGWPAAPVPDGPFGFIVTSFAPEYDEDCDVISAALRSAGLTPVQLNRLPGTYQVDEAMRRLASEAEVVVVNASGNRHNVYFELGLALGQGTPIVLCSRRESALEFNVRNWNCLIYGTALELEAELPKWIDSARRRVRNASAAASENANGK